MRKIENRVGEVSYRKDGARMVIVSYRSSIDMDVLFENGYLAKNVIYNNFKTGAVRNLYDKTMHGIGFIGEGKYHTRIRHYQTWSDMLERCYDSEYHKQKPSYIECDVDQEWHNYQNFASWYDENYYQVDDEEMNLDKDILTKGNKLYSSNTCIFVPQRINKLFIRHNQKSENDLPRGVCKHGIRFKAQCAHSGKNKHIGIYDTPQEAHSAYKKYKEMLIKEIANSYRSKIPDKLYKALMNYEVS